MPSNSVSNQSISTVRFNCSGDWIALGCSGLGQLLVWEWQSESYILKQQGHFNAMTCLQYSPDGQYIVTGGDDAKVSTFFSSSPCPLLIFSASISLSLPFPSPSANRFCSLALSEMWNFTFKGKQRNVWRCPLNTIQHTGSMYLSPEGLSPRHTHTYTNVQQS